MKLTLPQSERGGRNHPPPCDITEAQKELTRLGGETSGRPNLIFEWGQEAREFARGTMRIKYPTRMFRETKTFRYGKPVTGEGLAASIVPITHLEWLRRRKKKIPAFHKLVRWDVEWMGVPRWVIGRFITPDKLGDTPETWNANRYEYHERRPGLWIPTTYIPHLNMWREDVNGPFPEEGRYEFFDYVKRDDGSLYGLYKNPDGATLAHVGKRLAEQTNEHPTYRLQRAFKETEERYQREEDEMAERAEELLYDWRHILMPDEYPRSANSRFGKN